MQIFLSRIMKLYSKKSIVSHPPLTFNSIPVTQINSPKNLGMQLDKKLSFKEHLAKLSLT